MSIDGLLQSIRTVDRADTVHARTPVVVIAPTLDLLALAVVAGPMTHAAWLGVAWMLATMAVLAGAGSYRSRIAPRVTDDLPRLLSWMCVPLAVLAAAATDNPAVRSLLRHAPVAVGLLVAARVLSYSLVRLARVRGLALPDPTLIVGAGAIGEDAARVLREHPEYGLVPIGFLDGIDDNDLTLPLLGSCEQLEAVVREFGVRQVIVAFGTAREAELVPLLRACSVADVDVHVLPRFFELGVSAHGHAVEDLWGLPLVHIQRAANQNRTWWAKRLVDMVVASIGLVLALPIMAVIAVVVRLTSDGPVLFRQKRVGLRGNLVEILKFRTLRENTDSDTRWSVEDDERVTAVGGILRKTGLDELPQLFNILRGDMSLVGPRPERPHFADQFSMAVPGYEARLRVPPGLTGWAQVHGLRGDTSIEDRARFDNHYIEHWSVWRDIVILARTVAAVLKRTFS